MSDYERKRIELELRSFTSQHLNKPADCQNLDQLRFAVRSLCEKIQDVERQFNYVPDWIYVLLAKYNAKQNVMIHVAFRKTYS